MGRYSAGLLQNGGKRAGLLCPETFEGDRENCSSQFQPRDVVVDLFAHSGTTLLACERLNRRCFTADIDPMFAEITIRRLEHYRKTGETGWQFKSPFPEVDINLAGEPTD